jgi:hypothetical protein
MTVSFIYERELGAINNKTNFTGTLNLLKCADVCQSELCQRTKLSCTVQSKLNGAVSCTSNERAE